MKKRTMERNFRKIKNQIYQIEDIVKSTKTGNLWEHEATVRKKLKQLRQFETANIRDYKLVYERYLELLNYISERLIEGYNKKNDTNFNFQEILENNYETYLRSGIISVLISKHIPKMVSKEFDRVFPENPKDEFSDARKIKRKFFLHLGETNTGKTYNAMERLKKATKGVYLSPLRILALENFEKLNNEGVKCNLITGEEEMLVEDAKHTSCTIEKLDINENYDIAVIDEIQMIQDEQRGDAWTRALLGLKCREIHICGALNAKEILFDIIEDCGDELEFKEYKRNIPLEIEYKAFSYKDAQVGDALVVFSKKRVLKLASHYSNLGIKSSLIYGDLPPEVRRKQYEQFVNKESEILITTDAIGMGVNLPIRRIVLMNMKKFDGNEIRYLTSQEVKQIGGRAGRKGIYDVGYVASYGNTQQFLEEMIISEDRNIEEAVIGPSEAILKVKSLPLREKLALWSTRQEKVPFYRKMDVAEYLIILDNLKKYKLDEIIKWKLIRIPFDVTDNEMMSAFLNYVDEVFIAKKDFITKPTYRYKELNELELYYQRINLYYSFSKNFGLNFDKDWVYEERMKVSEYINTILVNI
ncbi:ATP-dependent RNA helicase DeaD [Clostridium acetireducens DSM 10703]|uniref:RNA helicase n=1 Tax=Clostridium acetireducens DSM 10703 TaxID=1121290 RepID=A0A1E8EXY1_9CLOT|nr:helicase-related protein [Clostridium acetireducens]OFI05542.1 ATP-dependent RNA helicase DeaD [Clostridium acetireducens DSM 10703]